MQDIWTEQASLIDQGKKIDFRLGEIVYPLGIMAIFFADRGQLTFHQLELGMNDLRLLVPGANVDEEYEYNQAIVIKKDRQPLLALCRGLGDNSQPIAALFNLTRPGSKEVIVAKGPKRQVLENNHLPAGGLGLSRMLRGNSQRELLQLACDEVSFSVKVLSKFQGA